MKATCRKVLSRLATPEIEAAPGAEAVAASALLRAPLALGSLGSASSASASLDLDQVRAHLLAALPLRRSRSRAPGQVTAQASRRVGLGGVTVSAAQARRDVEGCRRPRTIAKYSDVVQRLLLPTPSLL